MQFLCCARQVYRQLRSQELDGLRKAVLCPEGTDSILTFRPTRLSSAWAGPGPGLHRDASQLTDGGYLGAAEKVYVCVLVS